jgi:hypothetical protein
VCLAVHSGAGRGWRQLCGDRNTGHEPSFTCYGYAHQRIKYFREIKNTSPVWMSMIKLLALINKMTALNGGFN